MQKSFVKDYLTHKSVKNTGQVPAYIYKKHHEPIIPKAQWERVQEILDNPKSRKVQRLTHRSKTITIAKGRLSGFIIIDVSWNKNIKKIF